MSGVAFGDFYATYNIAWLLSFFLMVAIVWATDWPVRNIFVEQLDRASKYIAKKTGDQESEVLTKLQDHFDLDTASLIGKLERILYVFGIMFGGAFAIISGWIVLKAFNTWLEVFEEGQQRSTDLTQIIVGHAVAKTLEKVPEEIENYKKGTTAQKAKVSRMVYYHLYLIDNATSLMAGVTLGFIGLQLAAWAPVVIAKLCGAG
jgi:hypothetical protein